MIESVFFSWQIDTGPDQVRLLRKCLKRACKALEKKPELGNPTIQVDEATQDLPGSPSIPDSIREKILNADVFVADLTLINSGIEQDQGRLTPNPNVLFELGFAVAELGWDRVILPFNASLPMKAEDLPFDVRVNRASPFNGTDEEGLTTLLTTAIGLVLLKQPPRPDNTTQRSPEEIKRTRDINALRAALSCIDMSVIDRTLESAPGIIVADTFHHYESLNGVVSATTFHLYDEDARKLVYSLRDNWGALLSFGVHYTDLNSGDYKFKSHLGSPITGSTESDWKKMEGHVAELKRASDGLVRHVQEHYLELDVEDLSELAAKERSAFLASMPWA